MMVLLKVLARPRAAARRAKALHPQRGGKNQPSGSEIDGHGAKVEVLHMHRAHGAKQQRGREHNEHQVGQVLDRRGANPAAPPRKKTQRNEQNDRNQGRKNGRVHGVAGAVR
jgi:hypothetical protein